MKYDSTALFINNIEVSRDFYTRVMGLDIIMDNGNHVAFMAGLNIWERDSAESIIFGEKQPASAVRHMELCFAADDVEAEYKRIQNMDINIINPLAEQPWKQLLFRITDPDGNIVEIAESIENTYRRLKNDGLSLDEISEQTYTNKEDLVRILNDGACHINCVKS